MELHKKSYFGTNTAKKLGFLAVTRFIGAFMAQQKFTTDLETKGA